MELLVRRCGSKRRALSRLSELNASMGLPEGAEGGRALVALALVSLGLDLERVARLLTWQEFEEFCAQILVASGFRVTRNVTLSKPRRQIDIIAESETLTLSIDCKHWNASHSSSSLGTMAEKQIERTSVYKKKRSTALPFLPVIVTLFAAQARLVRGVPVVPLLALRSFLSSVSRFDGELLLI